MEANEIISIFMSALINKSIETEIGRYFLKIMHGIFIRTGLESACLPTEKMIYI